MADKFTVVAQVKGTDSIEASGDKKARVVIELVDGETGEAQKWSTWNTGVLRGLVTGEWYTVELETPPDERGGVWHNFIKTIGPAQKPAGAPAAKPAANGNGGSRWSPEQAAAERLSINRHGAVKAINTLIEAGALIPHAEDDPVKMIDQVLGFAEIVETWYNRPHAAATPAPAAQPAPAQEKPAPAAQGSDAAPQGGPVAFANVGGLMQHLHDTYGKPSGDVLALLGVKKASDITDLDDAAKRAKEAWGDG